MKVSCTISSASPLVVEHIDAEPEQLRVVLAMEPSCRVVVVAADGDLGDQAYLVRPGSCSAVAPRHRPPPAPAKFYGFTCRSVHSGSAPGFSMRGPPRKNIPVERTDPLAGPVNAASTRQTDDREGMRTVPLMVPVVLQKPARSRRPSQGDVQLSLFPIQSWKGKSAMQSRKFRTLSAITAGSLTLAVVAITASSGTSQAATHAALTARTESFLPAKSSRDPLRVS